MSASNVSNSSTYRLTRRGLLSGVLTATGGLLIAAPAAAKDAAAATDTTVWTRNTTANGWPVLSGGVSTAIEGSGGVRVTLADGLPTLLLGHFLRRYLYEVAGAFQRGDVVGYRDSRRINAVYESNYLSGTAVEVFGHQYPLGAADGMFPAERHTVEAILADFGGVIAWGGHLKPVKESHFEIGVPPGSTRLRAVADKITGITASESTSFTITMGRPRP